MVGSCSQSAYIRITALSVYSIPSILHKSATCTLSPGAYFISGYSSPKSQPIHICWLGNVTVSLYFTVADTPVSYSMVYSFSCHTAYIFFDGLFDSIQLFATPHNNGYPAVVSYELFPQPFI